jgi:hypothetical protein
MDATRSGQLGGYQSPSSPRLPALWAYAGRLETPGHRRESGDQDGYLRHP